MNPHVDVERLIAAHDTVRNELLGERTVGGHWVGELASSPLATATAVSALVIAHGNGGLRGNRLPSGPTCRTCCRAT